MSKKKKQMIGSMSKMVEITIEYPHGHTSVENADHATEVLDVFETVRAQIEPVMQTLEIMRRSVTDWAVRTKTDVVQLDGRYWRKVQRMQRRWVTRPSEMPQKRPKGAKSLQDICKGRTTPKGTPLFNAVTTRMADPEKISQAVAEGWITEDEIQKAYIEFPQAPFLQRYEGEAKD